MKINPTQMNQKLYEKGELVGTYNLSPEILNMLCDSITHQGYKIDWHYLGGVAVVKTFSKEKIENFNDLFQMYADLYMEYKLKKYGL